MTKSYSHLINASEGQWIYTMHDSGMSVDDIKQAVKDHQIAGENADAIVEYVLGHIDDAELDKRLV